MRYIILFIPIMFFSCKSYIWVPKIGIEKNVTSIPIQNKVGTPESDFEKKRTSQFERIRVDTKTFVNPLLSSGDGDYFTSIPSKVIDDIEEIDSKISNEKKNEPNDSWLYMQWHNYWDFILVGILLVPIVACVVFKLWLSCRKKMTLTEGAECWESFTKLISAFTVIFTGAMLVGKHIEQQSVSETNKRIGQLELVKEGIKSRYREQTLQMAKSVEREIDSLKKRNERNRILLTEASRAAATISIAIENSETPDNEIYIRFMELYWADLIGVEGKEVFDAMVKFEMRLRNRGEYLLVPLNYFALALSHAVENQLKEEDFEILKLRSKVNNLMQQRSKI